jgi:predicted nucleic acid-binding protein
VVVVVDTGVLYAAADTRDGDHHACRDLLETRPAAELLVPAPVIVEAAWLMATRLGDPAEAAFIASVAAGQLTPIELGAGDYQRCAELLDTYADLHLGLVDAAVIAIAERHGITTVATLNHRDFTVVRPAHCDALDLIP